MGVDRIHSKSEDPDPNYPAKKLNFPQICPKMPQNGPKMTQNYPKWPKNDAWIYALFPQFLFSEKAVPQTFSLLECMLKIYIFYHILYVILKIFTKHCYCSK